MKKTYATPAIINSGDSIRETRGTGQGPDVPVGQIQAPGSVGFYL
jgi:hypothetical protein